MPALPVLAERGGDIRVVEIFEEGETEHAAQADGHVGITRKIEIELDRKTGRSQPGHREGPLAGGHGEDCVSHLAQGIGNNHFFGQPNDKPAYAIGIVAESDVPLDDFLGDMAISNDGAGDQLGNKVM